MPLYIIFHLIAVKENNDLGKDITDLRKKNEQLGNEVKEWKLET